MSLVVATAVGGALSVAAEGVEEDEGLTGAMLAGAAA